MRLTDLLQRLLCLMALCAVFSSCAQTEAAAAQESAAIQVQRSSISQEKKLVLDRFQTDSKSCWQKFAVNDCLANVRRQKYQALAPLDQREIQLNTRERELKEFERQQRLSDKSPNKGNS
ncbi:MAG: hypothetical protein RL462_1341 [Pseudomonadota bacterium]|jgi:hypothetical protein